jgi:hypothetical protein
MNHKEEWQKLYEKYNSEDNEESQYRARCIRGLLENKTYDYMERIPKPKEISFIK